MSHTPTYAATLPNAHGFIAAPSNPDAAAAPYNESVPAALEALRANLASIRWAVSELHDEALEACPQDPDGRLYKLWSTVDHYLERIDNAELSQSLFEEEA